MTKWFFFGDFVKKASTNIPKIEKALENLVAEDILAIQTIKAKNGRKIRLYEHQGAFQLRYNPLEQKIQDYIFEQKHAADSDGIYDYQVFHKFGNANKKKVSKQLVKYKKSGYLKIKQMELKLPNNIPAWERAYALKPGSVWGFK